MRPRRHRRRSIRCRSMLGISPQGRCEMHRLPDRPMNLLGGHHAQLNPGVLAIGKTKHGKATNAPRLALIVTAIVRSTELTRAATSRRSTVFRIRQLRRAATRVHDLSQGRQSDELVAVSMQTAMFPAMPATRCTTRRIWCATVCPGRVCYTCHKDQRRDAQTFPSPSQQTGSCSAS